MLIAVLRRHRPGRRALGPTGRFASRLRGRTVTLARTEPSGVVGTSTSHSRYGLIVACIAALAIRLTLHRLGSSRSLDQRVHANDCTHAPLRRLAGRPEIKPPVATIGLGGVEAGEVFLDGGDDSSCSASGGTGIGRFGMVCRMLRPVCCPSASNRSVSADHRMHSRGSRASRPSRIGQLDVAPSGSVALPSLRARCGSTDFAIIADEEIAGHEVALLRLRFGEVHLWHVVSGRSGATGR